MALSVESRARGLPLIGWNEYVDIPEWGIRGLRAKVDTGARSSALHVEHIERLPHGRVRFEVVLHREKRDRRVRVEARVVRQARVRSSNGEFSYRLFVRTRLRLGEVDEEVELSLVDRGRMIHRMLIGRTALDGRFLIDVGHRNLLTKPPKRKKKVGKKKVGKKKTSKRVRRAKSKKRSAERSG